MPRREAMVLLDRVGVGAPGDEAARSALGRPAAARRDRPRARDEPKVMLFDEPTSALDPEMINEVLDVMVGLAARRHDDDRRDPRDGLRPQGRRPRRLHGRRAHRRGGDPRGASSRTRRAIARRTSSRSSSPTDRDCAVGTDARRPTHSTIRTSTRKQHAHSKEESHAKVTNHRRSSASRPRRCSR